MVDPLVMKELAEIVAMRYMTGDKRRPLWSYINEAVKGTEVKPPTLVSYLAGVGARALHDQMKQRDTTYVLPPSREDKAVALDGAGRPKPPSWQKREEQRSEKGPNDG